MSEKATISAAQPETKSWSDTIDDALHSKLLGAAVLTVGVGAAALLSRGRLLGSAEKILPSADKVLDLEALGSKALPEISNAPLPRLAMREAPPNMPMPTISAGLETSSRFGAPALLTHADEVAASIMSKVKPFAPRTTGNQVEQFLGRSLSGPQPSLEQQLAQIQSVGDELSSRYRFPRPVFELTKDRGGAAFYTPGTDKVAISEPWLRRVGASDLPKLGNAISHEMQHVGHGQLMVELLANEAKLGAEATPGKLSAMQFMHLRTVGFPLKEPMMLKSLALREGPMSSYELGRAREIREGILADKKDRLAQNLLEHEGELNTGLLMTLEDEGPSRALQSFFELPETSQRLLTERNAALDSFLRSIPDQTQSRLIRGLPVSDDSVSALQRILERRNARILPKVWAESEDYAKYRSRPHEKEAFATGEAVEERIRAAMRAAGST